MVGVDLPVTPVAYAVMELARTKQKSVLVTASATSDITAKFCSPTLTHWADDTHALAGGTAKALIDQPGGKTWYFIAVDIAFGAALQRDATEVIEAAGGKVVGSTRHPTNAGDFSSLVIQAQNSKAPMIGLASVGADLVNIIKQAKEFNVGPENGQNLVGLLIYINDIHALGLNVAQNLVVTTGFYWDQNDKARAFAKRFFDQRKTMPSKNGDIVAPPVGLHAVPEHTPEDLKGMFVAYAAHRPSLRLFDDAAAALQRYLGGASVSGYDREVLPPTEGSFAAGSKGFTCLAARSGAGEVTGSLRG